MLQDYTIMPTASVISMICYMIPLYTMFVVELKDAMVAKSSGKLSIMVFDL